MNVTRPDRTIRRLVAIVALATIGVAPGAAASSPPDSTEGAAAGSTADSTVGLADDADGYPRTIEHANGETVIETAPERIVAVGITDETTLLAFGVHALGYAPWYGDGQDLAWPWVADLWAGAEAPVEITDENWELKLETIAELDPDLIVGLWFSADGALYDKLAAIAPTVVMGEPDDQNHDWREATQLVGDILDQEERADELIATVDDGYAAFRESHPQVAELSAAWTAPETDGTMWVTSAQDNRGQFLGALGFAPGDEVEAVIPEGDAWGLLSAEQYELLDPVDLLVVAASDQELADQLEANPLWTGLAPVEAGNVIMFVGNDEPVGGAIGTSTALSLTYAIDAFAEVLPASLGG